MNSNSRENYFKNKYLKKILESRYLNKYLEKKLNFKNHGKIIYDYQNNLEYVLKTDIGRQIFFNLGFEEHEIKFCVKILKTMNEPVIFEIGANIGYQALKWAKTNQSAIVYAFEPSPTTFEILNRNIKLNNLEKNIFTYQKALSDKDGTAEFFETIDNAFNSLKDTLRRKLIDKIEVEIITLDSFVFQNMINKIDFIKIDVEGFEFEVIKGATNTIQKFKPYLLVEITTKNLSIKPEILIETIKSFGYNAYVFNNDRIDKFTEHSNLRANYLFVNNEINIESIING